MRRSGPRARASIGSTAGAGGGGDAANDAEQGDTATAAAAAAARGKPSSPQDLSRPESVGSIVSDLALVGDTARDIGIATNRRATDMHGCAILLLLTALWCFSIFAVVQSPRDGATQLGLPTASDDNGTAVRCGGGAEAGYPYAYPPLDVCMNRCPQENDTVCAGCHGAADCPDATCAVEAGNTTSLLWTCSARHNAPLTVDNMAAETWLGRWYLLILVGAALLMSLMLLAVLLCKPIVCVTMVFAFSAIFAAFLVWWFWQKRQEFVVDSGAEVPQAASDEASYFYLSMMLPSLLCMLFVAGYIARVNKRALDQCCELWAIAMKFLTAVPVISILLFTVVRVALVAAFLYVEMLIMSLVDTDADWERYRLGYHLVNIVYFAMLLNVALSWLGYALCHQLTSWYFSQSTLSSLPKALQTSRHGWGVVRGLLHFGSFVVQACLRTVLGWPLALRNVCKVNRTVVVFLDLSVYVVTVVHGSALFESSRVASAIVRSNLSQFLPATIKPEMDFVWFTAKALVASVAAVVAATQLNNDFKADLNVYFFGIGPFLVFWGTAYVVADTMFTGVHTVSHGLLLLSVLDVDMTATAQPHAPQELLAFYTRHAPKGALEGHEAAAGAVGSRPSSVESDVSAQHSRHGGPLQRQRHAPEAWGDEQATGGGSALKYAVSDAEEGMHVEDVTDDDGAPVRRGSGPRPVNTVNAW